MDKDKDTEIDSTRQSEEREGNDKERSIDANDIDADDAPKNKEFLKTKIDEETAVVLDDFLNHKPYFKFFQDAAYAATRVMQTVGTKVLQAMEVSELIPYLFVPNEKGEVGFIAEEVNLLFAMFISAKQALTMENKLSEKAFAAAKALLETSNIQELHTHIAEFKETMQEKLQTKTSQ
jgi:hypothetical protein